VVEAGRPKAPTVLFLHGWPESWRSWKAVMELASAQVHAVAIDLPGVGESTGETTDGSKAQLARAVSSVIAALRLDDVTLVGHDVGGMVAHAHARAHDGAERVVVMNTVLPGLDPWDEVLRNPALWHFAMHAVPHLPERLVQGRQAAYFDYFYDTLAADPTRITVEARGAYAAAYATDSALAAGFSWYRALPRDATENRTPPPRPMTTPLLYLRGEYEQGDIDTHVAGLRAAGAERVEQGIVRGAGHFAPEEAPDATWRLIAEFMSA
jgi:pimeloyl-ACP methyl ester carboxylesterase